MAGGPRPTRPRSAGRSVTAESTATIPAWDAAEAEALYALLEQQIGAGILQPRRPWHPDRMGRANAREHGPADALFFRQSNRARIHREELFAGR